jgi:hypothetical protein
MYKMPWAQPVTRMAGIHEESEHDESNETWAQSFPAQTATNMKDMRGRKSFDTAASEFDQYNQVNKTKNAKQKI